MFFNPFFAARGLPDTEFQARSREAYKTFQETATRQAELMRSFPFPFEYRWKDGEMPTPFPRLKALDPNWTRDAFHAMADSNLRQWEQVANHLQAQPDWMKWAWKSPSEFWSRWFDYWLRVGSEEAGPMAPSTEPATRTQDAPAAAPPAPSNDHAPGPDGPVRLDAPAGTPDDLTVIKGIGNKINALLNELGIFHYSQIAEWTEADMVWIDDKLQFKGRVERESWVPQARALVAKAA